MDREMGSSWVAGGLVRLGILVAVAAFGIGLSAPSALAEPVATGVFGGVVFTDLNTNGTQDSGESGLGGVTVFVAGGADFAVQQTTDSAGRFSFPAVPTGRYRVTYFGPDDWQIYGLTGGWGDEVEIDQSPAHADVRIPAVRPLSKWLSASLIFDRTRYEPADTVHLTAVIDNTGDNPVTGVTVSCQSTAGGPELSGGGPGWGVLDPAGPGLSLPGASRNELDVVRSVRVSEPMPRDAPRFGYVSARFCSFHAAHHPQSDEVSAGPLPIESARVSGLPGIGKARIYRDANDDNQPDDGEQVAGATVVVTDPDTGAVVARPVTDANGEFAVADLPAAVYDVRIDGSWQPKFGAGQLWFQVPVVATDAPDEQSFAIVPGPAGDNSLPNLKMSAEFEKPAYKSGETIKAKVTITNIGGVPATGVHVVLGGFSYDLSQRGDLGFPGPGGTIGAGASRVLDLSGPVNKADAGSVSLGGFTETGNGDANPMNDWVDVAVPLTATRGGYRGTLYGDRNDNGSLDPGEVLARVPIQLRGGVPFGTFTETTDESGRFSFTDVPTGEYNVGYQLPSSWIVDQAVRLTIDDGDHPAVLVHAVRPLSARLTASVRFAKTSYAKGEAAQLTVTLTNTGASELTGVTAFCTGPGDGNEIAVGPGWGALADQGVTVPVATTRTFDVVSTVPDGSEPLGVVTAGCIFTAHNQPGDVLAEAEANVPGQSGSAHGVLVYDRSNDGRLDGDGVPNTKVVLVEEGTGRVVARARTDATGKFGFADVPANRYEFRVVGPWKLLNPNDSFFKVVGRTDRDAGDLKVVPGAVQPDPDDPHPATGGPAAGGPVPQGGVPPRATHLASTGASVVGWTVGGLAALGLGLLLLLFRRRGATG